MAIEWSGDLPKLVEQLAAIQPRLDLDDDAPLELFWEFHPRYRFIKSLPWASNLLDLGAGDGGLAHWRGWGKPARPDLNLYGVDLRDGEHQGLYAGWETLDLDRQLPDFSGSRLNAFLATHLIEHLAEPEELIRWIAERVEAGSRIYLEWPNAETLHLPRSDERVSGDASDRASRGTRGIDPLDRRAGRGRFADLSRMAEPGDLASADTRRTRGARHRSPGREFSRRSDPSGMSGHAERPRLARQVRARCRRAGGDRSGRDRRGDVRPRSRSEPAHDGLLVTDPLVRVRRGRKAGRCAADATRRERYSSSAARRPGRGADPRRDRAVSRPGPRAACRVPPRPQRAGRLRSRRWARI